MPAFGALVASRKKGDHRSLRERNEAQKKHRENNAAASIRLITRDSSIRSLHRSFTRRPQSELETKKGSANGDADADADADQASWDSNDDYDLEYDYHDTALGWILKKIEPVIITLIVANAITMGMGTFDFVVKDPKMEDIFEIVDTVFLVIFSVEVSLAAFHYLRLDSLEWLGFGDRGCCGIGGTKKKQSEQQQRHGYDGDLSNNSISRFGLGDKLHSGTSKHSGHKKSKIQSSHQHNTSNSHNHNHNHKHSSNGDGSNDQHHLYSNFIPKFIAFRPMHSIEAAERKANLPWITFDASVVILSWSFQKLSIIRAFRILRALRIISKVESMRRVMRGVFSIGPKMGMVGFLLSLLLLVFGIMFTQLYSDLYIEGYSDYDYFGTFFLSLLTLFQIMTFDNWHWIARDAMKRDKWAWVLFVIWVLVSGFVIMNMIIAIVCESLVTMSQDSLAAKEAKQRAAAGLDDHSINGSIATLVDFRVYQMQEMIDETLMDQDELLIYAAQLRKVVRQLLVHDKVTARNKMKLREVLMKIERKDRNKKNMNMMRNMLKIKSKTLRNIQDL